MQKNRKMKRTKQIVFIIVSLIFIGGIGSFFYFKNKFMNAPPNKLTVSNLGKPFKFIWQGEKINGTYEPNIAMYVPVSIPGVDRTFYMQFDTGAPSTVLYYNKVKSINEKYGNVFQLDTVNDHLQVTNASLNIGTVKVEASSIDFRGMSNEINWSDSTFIKIGTVGSDFLEKHILSIDFKKEQITLNEKMPEIIDSNIEYLPFTFDGRKIFLSAKLNNEPADLWYDSGSSAFELIVEESTFLELAKSGAKKVTYTGNSWGKPVAIHNIESKGKFEFGKTLVPLNYVTYMEWPNKMQAWLMKASNIGGDLGGMTGNKLFLGKTLILDTPNLRYSVLD